MKRRKFIQQCGYTAISISTGTIFLSSCGSIYYADVHKKNNHLEVAKSEFISIRKNDERQRQFVLLKEEKSGFPICLYRHREDEYTAALLKCTHRSCELNVGGNIYSCPCHGSEFSIHGEVLQGPADQHLKLFRTETDNENIYIYLS